MFRTMAALAAGLSLALGATALVLGGTARAETAAGDWLGAVIVNPTLTSHMAVHIHATAQGGYAGTVDSLDYGAFDIALADVSVQGDTLSFAVPAVSARFEGKWDPATTHWVGRWTQGGRAIELELAPGVAPPAPTVAGLDGEWDGALDMGTGLKLRLAFHIKTGPHGTIGTVDSVDQGSYGAPVSAISREGDQVRLEVKVVNGAADGQLIDDGKTIAARFTQNGIALPLVLKRLPDGAPSPWPAPAKPQPAAVNWTLPSDTEIRKLLADRIDAQHQGVGIVVGVIGPSGRRIVAYGRRDQGDARPLDGDTEFEIGSITKVFTSLVLVDMVQRGEVKLDDPAAKYLPPGVKMPEKDGKQITLVDLATHTSGLPRLPGNIAPKDPANPYADYSTEQLYQFLSGYQLTRDPGAQWDYSNLGVGLLGHLLARRAGVDYETLVKARVLGPLRMASTTITLTPEETARLAAGHNSSLVHVPGWDLPTLAGAGALRSTANDLLTFLAANLGYADTPLKADMAAVLAVSRPMPAPNMQQALGWEVRDAPAGKIVQHGGGTGGYHTYIAFDPRRRTGVVVLTNAETIMGGDDIALHILTGSPVATLAPPPPPPPVRTAIAVPPEVLQRYVGVYQLAPQVVITVTRDGDRLFAQLTGQGAFEIFPESQAAFFWKVVDAQATFDIGPDGRATGLVLHQGGRDLPARRIEATTP